MTKLLKNRCVHILIAVIIGIAAGFFLKDTKSIEERVKEKITEKYKIQLELERITSSKEVSKLKEKMTSLTGSSREYRKDTSRKLTVLKQENYQLKQKVTKRRYKLIKPDGTIIEREFEESDMQSSSTIVTSIREEFARKISSIEKKWKKVHILRIKDLKKKFDEKLKKKEIKIIERVKYVDREKIVKINEKKLRLEAGLSSNLKAYSHSSYPIWGSLFIGGGISIDRNMSTPEGRIGIGLEF